MFVSRNVLHVVSVLYSIVYHYILWFIRSLIDPTLAAWFICGPLELLVSYKCLRAQWLSFIGNKPTDTWFYNLYDTSTSERGPIWQLWNRKKQIDVSFSCVCPVIDNKFRQNVVEVVCRSTRLSSRGSTATATAIWQDRRIKDWR